MFWC